jgi:hypothetical protein
MHHIHAWAAHGPVGYVHNRQFVQAFRLLAVLLQLGKELI